MKLGIRMSGLPPRVADAGAVASIAPQVHAIGAASAT
jgi:hypothetical protein